MRWLSGLRKTDGSREHASRASGATSDPLELLPDAARRFIRTAYLPGTVPGSLGGGTGFGGQPLLPDGVEHPNCPRCGQPLPLLAQLALDDLPPDARPTGSGLLQVFYCTRRPSRGGQPCGAALDGWAPFSKAHVVRLVADRRGRPSEAETPLPPRRVAEWRPVRECPNGEEMRELGIDLSDDTWNALGEAGIPYGGEKLGGWPDWVQGVEYPDCPRCGSTMRHVLQIDSERNIPFMFGDVGTGHVTQCPEHADVLAFGWACA